MRTRFEDISAPSVITPVAQPVNSYVRPADPAPSPLHDIAQGLAAFDAGLSSFMEKRQGKDDEAQKIKAEAAFNENNAVGWSEAVRRGLVPANASPVFMKSYKAAQGNLAGVQLREKFNSEYLKWPGRNSNDPAAFQQFLGDYIRNNVDSDDVDVLRGLNPHVKDLWTNGHDVFGRDSAKSVYEGQVNTKAAIANRTVAAADEEGIYTGQGTDYEKLWTDLGEQRKETLASGVRKEDFDPQLAATIAAKAVELHDPKLLDLLDRTVEGDEVALKDYPAIAKIKQDAMEKLEGINRQQLSDRDREQAKQDKAKEEAITTGVIQTLATDPNQTIPEDVLTELEKYNPKARIMIAEARKTLADSQTFEDPREILLIQRDIAEGKTRRGDLLKMLAEGKIRDPATFTALIDRVDKFNKSRQDGSGILTGQTTKRYAKTIAERMKGPLENSLSDVFGNVVMNDEALQAINDFESGLMEWDDKNPGAGVLEREKFINEMGQTILERINPDLMSRDPSKYTGDADQAAAELAADQAKSAKDAAQAADQAAARQAEDLKSELSDTLKPFDKADPAAVEGQVDEERNRRALEMYQGDKAPAIDTLPETHRKYIEEEAAKANMTPEELNDAIWQRMKKVQEPQPGAEPTGEQQGMLEKGNIDLTQRPTVRNDDGTISTVKSMSFEEDGKEVLVPTISPDGKVLSEEEAIKLYRDTGQHLGKFDSPEAANAYAEKLHKAQEAYYGDDGATLDPTSFTPDEALGSIIQAAYTEEPGDDTDSTPSDAEVDASKGILNLLGDAERTDKGRGYNETLAYGAYTGGPVELTKMTIGEVKKLQRKMLAHPDNSWNSSAVGRYQIVGKTLRSLQKRLGIGDDEFFDEAMQDRLAVSLLKGRGYDDWKAGRLSDDAFMDKLSEEWASLPTTLGKSYYSNQGVGTSRNALLTALKSTDLGDTESSPFDAVLSAPKAYANVPKEEVSRFMEWNSDPVANHEANLKSIKPDLAKVIKLAQERSGLKFVIGSGKRDKVLQKKAMEWGWSKTMESNHLHGDAADLWPVNEDGVVDFSPESQAAIVEAMKAAAAELNMELDVGADWKGFKDVPHFGLKKHKHEESV